MTTEETPDPIRLLRELIAAFNRYDLDTAMSFFVDDCVYQTPRGRRPWGRKITGKQEVRLAFERQFGRFEDARFVKDSHWVSGDRAASEWTIVGTLRTGEHAELWGCDLWTFRGGKIAVRNSFWKIPLMTGAPPKARPLTRSPEPGAAPRSPPPARE
jgi:ketosteroid isomerase-like protein